jgi:hypothetical protein
MLSREEVILKIEELKKELKTCEGFLRVLDRNGMGKRTGPEMRFYQARPQTCIVTLLRERGPQTHEQLMKDLQAGGIAIGKKRGMHNPRISIERTLKTGALKKVGNLIGMPEWPDEKFKE